MSQKTCVICKDKFERNNINRFRKWCSPDCGYKHLQNLEAKKQAANAKEERKDLKEKKEGLLTHKDYLNILQKVFNAWVRMRDKDLPCISCGCDMKGRKGDASHFYSVGGNANLRFNPDNVHLSCVHCNQHKHGNLLEYAERLPNRIGVERFEKLKRERNAVVKLSIPEIKELIADYRQKIKELKIVN